MRKIGKYQQILENINKYWKISGKLENIRKYLKNFVNIWNYQENWEISRCARKCLWPGVKMMLMLFLNLD